MLFDLVTYMVCENILFFCLDKNLPCFLHLPLTSFQAHACTYHFTLTYNTEIYTHMT